MEFIIFVFIILYIIQKKSKKEQNTTGNPNKYKEINSYYNKNKLKKYSQMETDHASHNGEKKKEDPCHMIGYQRCPNCNNTVSLKAKTCFMCNYVFVEEQNEKN